MASAETVAYICTQNYCGARHTSNYIAIHWNYTIVFSSLLFSLALSLSFSLSCCLLKISLPADLPVWMCEYYLYYTRRTYSCSYAIHHQRAIIIQIPHVSCHRHCSKSLLFIIDASLCVCVFMCLCVCVFILFYNTVECKSHTRATHTHVHRHIRCDFNFIFNINFIFIYF